MPEFVAQDVVKEFETANGPLRILDGVSLTIDSGQNLAIVGESGSGKSTFLHLAGTLDQATSGSLEFLQQNPASFNEKQLAEFRNENIGFVFQQHHLLPQLTALENVLIPFVAQGATTTEMVERCQSLLEKVGLADRMNHRPGLLSGGERQRVAVARAMVRQPKMLLADEPTCSLDQANADTIGQLLIEMQQETETILICVTHSDRLAGKFDKTLRLEAGKFV